MVTSVQSDTRRQARKAGTRIATVFISNLSEDVWPFILSIKNRRDQSHEIQENALLSDRDILSFIGQPSLGPVRIILPHAPLKNFLPYLQSIFEESDSQLQTLTPHKHTGEICLDIMTDIQLMQQLVEFGKTVDEIHVLSYSTSEQFLRLVQELRNRGLNVVTPQAPELANSWTVNFFGSKTGIRQLIPEHMAPGKITTGRNNASALAAMFYVRDNGVVLKIHKGHAGAGVMIVGPNEYPREYDMARLGIKNRLMQEDYWENGPIVVEQYIPLDARVGGGSPSVEFIVRPDGTPQYLYVGGMRVTPAGTFKGMEISTGVLPLKIEKEMIKIGRKIAKHYSKSGYRGYFDVDFVVDTKGNAIVTESNVRRTGGTHLYHVARALFGPAFLKKTYMLSNNLAPLPSDDIKTFDQLYQTLKPILFDKQTGQGLIIASVTVLKMQRFGYIIFGRDQSNALAIEKKMEKLLKSPIRRT